MFLMCACNTFWWGMQKYSKKQTKTNTLELLYIYKLQLQPNRVAQTFAVYKVSETD